VLGLRGLSSTRMMDGSSTTTVTFLWIRTPQMVRCMVGCTRRSFHHPDSLPVSA